MLLVIGITGVYHHTQFLLADMEVSLSLPRMAMNYNPPDLFLLSC
jgi:hypothetical protein